MGHIFESYNMTHSCPHQDPGEVVGSVKFDEMRIRRRFLRLLAYFRMEVVGRWIHDLSRPGGKPLHLRPNHRWDWYHARFRLDGWHIKSNCNRTARYRRECWAKVNYWSAFFFSNASWGRITNGITSKGGNSIYPNLIIVNLWKLTTYDSAFAITQPNHSSPLKRDWLIYWLIYWLIHWSIPRRWRSRRGISGVAAWGRRTRS